MSCGTNEPEMVREGRRGRAIKDGFCVKCKTEESTIFIRYVQYCDPCFLKASDLKFRTSLRSSRPGKIVPCEDALLAFSGGPSSRVMLQLFADSQILPAAVANNAQQPKYFGKVKVCHVDESCLVDPSLTLASGSVSTLEEAQRIVESYGYEFFGLRIEDVFDPEWTDSQCFDAVAQVLTVLPKEQLVTSGQAPELMARILVNNSTAGPSSGHGTISRQEKINRLKTLLDACTSLTTKETILYYFRSSLLAQVARRTQSTLLLLGDSATRVAIQIIGLTAIGRGFALPYETALISSWYPDCRVVRPMKEFLDKEVDLVVRHLDLKTTTRHGVDIEYTMKKETEKKSIQRLTQQFVTGLDKDFPSTVATICKTAQKLTAPKAASFSKKCPMCSGPVQNGVQEWKKRITVTEPPSSSPTSCSTSTASVETKAKESNTCCGGNLTADIGCCSDQSAPHCGTKAPTSATLITPPTVLEFSSLLCYGCLTNLRDLDLNQLQSLSIVQGRNGNYQEQETTTATAATTMVLPPFVAEAILAQTPSMGSLDAYKSLSAGKDPRESLREKIQDFLIEDSDDEDKVNEENKS